MRKKLLAAILIASIWTTNLYVVASPNRILMIPQAPVLQQIRCTCYVQRGVTASGQYVRNGIVAGKREWLGKTCALYSISEDGKVGGFIGFYEFLDTGAGIDTDGDGKGDSIIKGTSIDVWQPSMKKAREWVAEYGDYVWLQILESEG